MSIQQSIKFTGHPNIYTPTSTKERPIRVEFSVPDRGIDSETGLLVLVPGFGGHIDSKVYQKMRRLFADSHNLVVLQCNYFGSRFMQDNNHLKINFSNYEKELFSEYEKKEIMEGRMNIAKCLSQKKAEVEVFAVLDEDFEEEFNDMSFMQAIDILSAIESLKMIIEDNGYHWNISRVIGNGHSHGAYILHLCNILAPNYFSFIIDNSAWLKPTYLDSYRYTERMMGQLKMQVYYEYIAGKKLPLNTDKLDLRELYKKSKSKSQILCFQGEEDALVDAADKEAFINTLPKSDFILIGEDDVDGKIFKSHHHSMDVDFIEFFDYAMGYEMKNYAQAKFKWEQELEIAGIKVKTKKDSGLPEFSFDFTEHNS